MVRTSLRSASDPDTLCRRDWTRLLAMKLYFASDVPLTLAALSRQMTAQGYSVQPKTLGKWLAERSAKRSVGRTVLLDARLCAGRLKAAEHFTEHPELYGNLVFSDEKIFEFDVTSGSRSVFLKCPGDPRSRVVTAGKRMVRFMVFGWITAAGEGELLRVPLGAEGTVTSDFYADLLRDHVRPWMARHPGLIWQQDGAGAHRGQSAREALQEIDHLGILCWPARSPDFSPIEKTWAYMMQTIGSLIFDRTDETACLRATWAAFNASLHHTRKAYGDCFDSMMEAKKNGGGMHGQRVYH